MEAGAGAAWAAQDARECDAFFAACGVDGRLRTPVRPVGVSGGDAAEHPVFGVWSSVSTSASLGTPVRGYSGAQCGRSPFSTPGSVIPPHPTPDRFTYPSILTCLEDLSGEVDGSGSEGEDALCMADLYGMWEQHGPAHPSCEDTEGDE